MVRSFTTFSQPNRRLISLLILSHLIWGCALFGLWAVGNLAMPANPWWTLFLIAFQLYGAAQLLLPVLLLHPEERNRGFYLFWGVLLALSVWLINQFSPGAPWLLPLSILKTSLLLLVATVTGAALARYVKRLWEIVPVCLVITLADFMSWLKGPTAGFARQIESYYREPVGPPPAIDMILVKLAVPGAADLVPVFGISDWIMVVFFTLVAHRFGLNDNLLGATGERLARGGKVGGYLPVPVVALIAAIVLAHLTGLFIPALPVVAVVMLTWFAGRTLLTRGKV